MTSDPEGLTSPDVLGMLTGSREDLKPSRWPRVSRPCYDKFHRCPGWAGGGTRYARVRRCDNGHLKYYSEGRTDRLWKWRVYRCPKCRVIVLPYVVRYLDWRYWWNWKRRDLARLAADWIDDRWPRYVHDDGDLAWSDRERVPLRSFLFALAVVGPAYAMWDVEWDENWRAWPHCCTQAGCWAHVRGPYCDCSCRWCRAARRIDRALGRTTARSRRFTRPAEPGGV